MMSESEINSADDSAHCAHSALDKLDGVLVLISSLGIRKRLCPDQGICKASCTDMILGETIAGRGQSIEVSCPIALQLNSMTRDAMSQQLCPMTYPGLGCRKFGDHYWNYDNCGAAQGFSESCDERS